MNLIYRALAAPDLPPAAVVPVTLGHIPLSVAALCLDDDEVFDGRVGVCPACGGSSSLPLARVLGEMRGAA